MFETIMLFLSFNRTINAYLLKKLITNNENRISLLYLLINCISLRSASQMLSLKDEYTLCFFNFLIIGFSVHMLIVFIRKYKP